MCKVKISPGVFFIVKILIFQVVKGLKGQKMPQNVESFCLWHLVFQETYIVLSSFTEHIYVWKDNISRHFFSFFSKFWYLESLGTWGREVKGQKMAQNDNIFCLSHSVSKELYIIWLWFLVPMYKMMISQANFFIFQNFVFWDF